MQPIEYIAVIASLLTIISVCFNIIQRRSRSNLIATLRSRLQASYNHFYKIAGHSDSIRTIKKTNQSKEDLVEKAINEAHSINGITDAARSDIIAYSREHLNFIPVEEHPQRPFMGRLPKPDKKFKKQGGNK